jgi:F0F1-type ATP synthase assembly protein I
MMGIFGPYLTMGMELAFAVVGMFLIGRWLDSLWNTSPWLMVVGLVIGVTGGFVRFFRKAIALGKEEDKISAEEKKRGRHED